METTIKKLPKSKIVITLKVSAKEFDKFLEKATFDLGKKMEIQFNGFRQGRAPKEVLEKVIGKERILKEATNLAIKENYLKAILESKIEAISQPEIEILKLPAQGNPLEFRATVFVLPEVNLPDYKKIASQVKKRKISVKEKEIKDSLFWLQGSRAKFTFKSKPCGIGDWVEIEFKTNVTGLDPVTLGDPATLGEKRDAFILGKGHLIPGIEEKLLGMRAGEEKTFFVTFPKEHFRKDLAGKKVEMKVKMKSVQNVEFPEINDQFAQSLGRFENLKALKRSVKEGIHQEKEIRESQRVRSEILEKIGNSLKIEIPEILIERERRRIIENLRRLVSQNLKISFLDYLARIKKSEKQLFDSLLPKAQKKVKDFLIIREIAKQEKIEVSKEEVREEINKILKRYPSIEKAEKGLDLKRLEDYTREAIRNDKTLAKLESFASNG